MNPERPDPERLAAWAAGLQASLEAGEARQRARQPLLARVAASAAAHASYTTVRRESGAWQPAGPGVQRRELRRDAFVRVELLRVADGCALPGADASDAAVAQELLLVEGQLLHADGASVLPAHSHAVLAGSQGLDGWRAQGAVLLYRRLLQADTAALPAASAQWWHKAMAASASRLQRGLHAWRKPGAWVDNSPGVQVLPLQAQAEVVSMLVRFEAGAGVPDHGHAIDEDCLVLQGEMFLGDILLRAGDYQLAPAGGGHFNENSDVGVCFYFHGALDAALLAKSPASR